jgi:4-amino-4-deoxy-L-arabinose transferase-like glycosyltransferase
VIPESSGSGGHWHAGLLLAGITALALAVRLKHFGESLYGDELFTFESSTASTLSGVMHVVNSNVEVTPPLFFVVAWLSQKLGDPSVWLRVPSLAAGVATVPLVYALGLRTVGRRAAMVGAAFFALSPFAAFYATEARAYALLAMLVVISTLALLTALEKNTWPWWAAYTVAVAAAMYTHYTAIFVLTAQAVWAVVTHRDRITPLLVATLGSVALYLPWLPGLAADRNAPGAKVIAELIPFGWSTSREQLIRLVAADPFGPLDTRLRSAGFLFLAAAAVVGLVGLWRRVSSRRTDGVSSQAVLIVILALAAPVGGALYSMVGDSVFAARDLISSLPAISLAFAALLTALPRVVSAVAITLAVVGLAFGMAASWQPDARRPAYQDVAGYVDANARPGDVVVELQPGGASALRIRLDDHIPYFRMAQTNDALRTTQASGGRIFYVRPDVAGLSDVTPPLTTGEYHVATERTWSGLYPLTLIVFEPTTR